MLKARLTRAESTEQGTFGVLMFGGQWAHSTELPWRDNARMFSCIPTGVYQVAQVRSPRFGLVYGVQNVPGRSHVLIHAANYGGASDLGWDTELHGCIAPAAKTGQLRNSKGRMQRAGLMSRPALNRLHDWAGGNPFELTIC